MTVSPASKESILVVDDALSTLEVLERNLRTEHYQVFTASSVPEAIRILEAAPVDLVITDFKMPEVSGIDLVRHVRENLKETEVIMITGYPSIDGAVTAVKAGAQEFLSKPFTDEELLGAVRRTLDRLQARKTVQGPSEEVGPSSYGLLGVSEAMQGVFRSIAKVISSSATVLISARVEQGRSWWPGLSTTTAPVPGHLLFLLIVVPFQRNSSRVSSSDT